MVTVVGSNTPKEIFLTNLPAWPGGNTICLKNVNLLMISI